MQELQQVLRSRGVPQGVVLLLIKSPGDFDSIPLAPRRIDWTRRCDPASWPPDPPCLACLCLPAWLPAFIIRPQANMLHPEHVASLTSQGLSSTSKQSWVTFCCSKDNDYVRDSKLIYGQYNHSPHMISEFREDNNLVIPVHPSIFSDGNVSRLYYYKNSIFQCRRILVDVRCTPFQNDFPTCFTVSRGRLLNL